MAEDIFGAGVGGHENEVVEPGGYSVSANANSAWKHRVFIIDKLDPQTVVFIGWGVHSVEPYLDLRADSGDADMVPHAGYYLAVQSGQIKAGSLLPIVVHAVKAAMKRNTASGDSFDVAIIDKEDYRELSDEEKKNITIEKIRQVVNWSAEVGLQVKGFFMMGHPLETEETLKETIRFAKELPLTDAHVTFVTPLPGSELYKTAHK